MQYRGFLRSAQLSLVALWMSVEFACAQGAWPSIEDVQRLGDHLASSELEDIMSTSTALLGPGPGTEGPGFLFRCNGTKTAILTFGAPSGGVELGECHVEGSAVCLSAPILEGEACYEIRRMDEWEETLFGLVQTSNEGPRTSAEGSAAGQPAMAVAFVPVDVYGLAAASGEMDLGGMTITLPSKSHFTFVHASGFPLRFVFQGEAEYETLILFLDQLGWPDQRSSTNTALRAPLQRQPQFDYLVNWEKKYAQRDLRQWGYSEALEVTAYRSKELDVDGSPCMQIHENIGTADETNDSGSSVIEEHVSQQLCISLTVGAMVGVTIKFPQPLDISAEQAEEYSEAIFSTLQLSSGTDDEGLGELSLSRFQELQGGEPDLIWEMLDCVQGWNRAAQVNGCNHAILRYPRVIEAGLRLLAGERLTEAEREEVRKTVTESRSTLALVHVVRAKLMSDEAHEQSREDCAAAQRIARELGDDTLTQSVADCP